MKGVFGPRSFGIAALLATAAATPAAAQSLQDKYWVEVSAYFPSINTDAAVSRPGFPGTTVDLESDLGLDKHETLPAVYAGWRVGRRFVLAGEYYALDRNGSRTLTRNIDFDGSTFTANTVVKSELHSDVYRLTLGYAFIQNDTAEVGAELGLHATDFKIGLSGQAAVGLVASPAVEIKRTDFLAPLPTLGLFATYEPMPKLSLTGRADYMSLKFGDYDGSIFNGQVAAGYRVYRNIDLGVAYRYVKYNLDVEKKRETTHLDYKFSGPSVFVRIGFQ